MSDTEEQIMEMKMNTYHPSQKKAILKYRDANRTKYNAYQKELYVKMKQDHPDYLDKRREQMRLAYVKRKEAKLNASTQALPKTEGA